MVILAYRPPTPEDEPLIVERQVERRLRLVVEELCRCRPLSEALGREPVLRHDHETDHPVLLIEGPEDDEGGLRPLVLDRPDIGSEPIPLLDSLVDQLGLRPQLGHDLAVESPERIESTHLSDELRCEVWSEPRSEEHTSELQSRGQLVCRLLLEKKKRARVRLSA